MQDNFMINLKSISVGVTIFRRFFFIIIYIMLNFNISHAELMIRKIIFEGNKSFKSDELKSLLKTKTKKEFDSKLYRMDKIILQNFYLTRGFLNVWVESELERDGDRIDINYKISEGRRYYLGEILFRGNESISVDKLREFCNIEPYEFFQMEEIESGLNKIEDFYFNNGKPYVELQMEQSFTDSLIYITINIIENETVSITKIDYQGLKNVKSFIIRRELEFEKGDIYSRSKIEKSQRNIYSTGLFDYVGMDLRAMDSIRTKASLLIRVVEKKTKWIGLRFGLGYEQEIVYGGTFDFTFEVGHRNLFGTARSLLLNVGPSFSYDFSSSQFTNPKNQYSLNYVEPWIGYTKTPGIFRIAFIQARPLNSAHYDYFNSSFLVQHEFENFWKISGSLSYNRVQILEGDSLDEKFYNLTSGQDFIYSLNSRLTRDKRDNFLNPGNGSILNFNGKIAFSKTCNNRTGAITNNQYLKLIIEWTRYQPFPVMKNWIFASRIKTGNIIVFDHKSVIPVSERFYLGGASSVRGFPEQLLGPVIYDETGKNPKALGGKYILLGNVELRIPLFWLFMAELFIDGGNLWIEVSELQLQDFRITTGIGLAILTPLGPFRFDYGFKATRDRYESQGEFHIGIAFSF